MKIPLVNRCREDSGNVIVKGSKLLALKKEILMPSMLVTLRRGKTEIWVVNGQSQEMTIPQAMCAVHSVPITSLQFLKHQESQQKFPKPSSLWNF
ncbi:hypothetical protein TNCV_4163361 [Trichonephila clavipes]|nr:hypothetical protein TNCV_4163361 [Trichonephila clavipes]